jgi:hypothetical protein
LDFLGFLWPILDFSEGYSESKQFFSSPVVSSSDMRQKPGSLAGWRIAAAGLIHVRGIVLGLSVFGKELSES